MSSSVKKTCTPNPDTTCSALTFPYNFIYRYNLFTGLYMLSPGERILANTIGFLGWGLLFFYVSSFVSGFFSALVMEESAVSPIESDL